MKGISSPISAAIIGIAFLALSIYTVYIVTEAVLNIYKAVKDVRRTGCEYIKILNATLYRNSTIDMLIVNEGQSSVDKVSELEMALIVFVGGERYTFKLNFCTYRGVGCWVPTKVIAGLKVYDIDGERALRPGEILYLKAYPQINGLVVDYGYIVIFTSCSKAERVLNIVSVEG